MTAIPKPPKGKKTGAAGPKLTEYDYFEIGEKIMEAMEYKNIVEITIYQRKQHEKFVGVVESADGQNGTLTLRVGYEEVKISINSIVSVK